VERLWAGVDTRFVMVGEIHGTEQSPAIFRDMVCHAAARGRVVVGLEHSAELQPSLDAFLRSPGSDADVAALKFATWTSAKDGRTSRAMLDLLRDLHRLKANGVPIRIVLFDVPRDFAGSAAERDAFLARTLAAAADANPAALVMAYAGNFHAGRFERGGGPSAYRSAAALLPRARTVTVNSAFVRGEAWYCSQAGCGPGPVNGADGPVEPRGVTSVDPREGPEFDYQYSPGEPFTASPPVGGG
jgi:hypothetical protein